MRKQIILWSVLLIAGLVLSLLTLSRSMADVDARSSVEAQNGPGETGIPFTTTVVPRVPSQLQTEAPDDNHAPAVSETRPPTVSTVETNAPIKTVAPHRTEKIFGDSTSAEDTNSGEGEVTDPDPYSFGCELETTLRDDFSGPELDTSKWNPDYPAGEREWQYYVEDVFEFEDGTLKIRAEKRSVRDRDYASGIITTKGIFDQKYGVFEIRAKVPAGQGLWPAFWLMPASEDYPPEIDVFEILGHEPETVYMSLHWRNEAGRHEFDTQYFTGEDMSDDFHVYAIRWTEDEIIWFVDGIRRARADFAIPDEPMFVLVNLAVGGEWPGYPDETTLFPSYLEVDYVRVAQIEYCE